MFPRLGGKVAPGKHKLGSRRRIGGSVVDGVSRVYCDSSDPPRPPPPLDRPAAAALVVEVNALKEENARVTAELARVKDELESRGPTPREAAQGREISRASSTV